MFVIRKEGRKFGKLTFRTYEKARQYIRKLMRKNKEKFAMAFTDAKRTNAAIGWGGFTIRQA